MFIYTRQIQEALRLAIQTHEIHEKQKRKGKDIAYITHPLTVGLILARINASDEVVMAGILHDTIEDSVKEHKVTREMLEKQFGKKVADLVASVTEEDKELSWEERKRIALEHIAHFSHDAVLVKSADILSNSSELVMDYEEEGETVFLRFNATKEDMLRNQLRAIRALIQRWPENPLASELSQLAWSLQEMGGGCFMQAKPARIMDLKDYDADEVLVCSVCDWEGSANNGGSVNTDDAVLDVSCPICGKMLLIAGW